MNSLQYPQVQFPHLPLYVGRPTSRPTDDRGKFHLHPHFEIVLLARGDGEFFSDFERYPLAAGALAFIAPGQLHGWFGDWSQFQLIVIGFQPTTLSLLPRLPDLPFFQVDMRPVVPIPNADQIVFTTLFETMYRHFQIDPTPIDLLVSYLYTLLLEARRVYAGQISTPMATPALTLTREFRELLEHNYAARWSVNDYAKRLGVTPNHLVKTVRQITGHTPGQIAQERLYLEARRLLVHSAAPINEIAEALAFMSPSQFGHWFKKFAGNSPAQFRLQASWTSKPTI